MSVKLSYVFGDVELFDHYMIVVMRQNVHISPDYNAILVELVNEHYKDIPFVYLTHRINSYTVDPAIYLETAKIRNLVGFGVIAKAPLAAGNATLEKLFMNKPFEIFKDLDEAVKWAKETVSNELQGS